jgi:hypothetical protein
MSFNKLPPFAATNKIPTLAARLSPTFHSHLDPVFNLSCKLPLPAALGEADPTAILPLALHPSVTISSSRDAPVDNRRSSMGIEGYTSRSPTLSRLLPRDDDRDGVGPPKVGGFGPLKRATTRCAPRPQPRHWLPSSVASCHRLQPLLREKHANVIEPCPLSCSWWVDVTRRRVLPSIKRPRSMSAGQPPPSSTFNFCASRGALIHAAHGWIWHRCATARIASFFSNGGVKLCTVGGKREAAWL